MSVVDFHHAEIDFGHFEVERHQKIVVFHSLLEEKKKKTKLEACLEKTIVLHDLT